MLFNPNPRKLAIEVCFSHKHDNQQISKRNKWICRETFDFFDDQFTLLVINSIIFIDMVLVIV